ncbi:MAG TPA: ATP-binding protein [Acidimicrobiia bacterium]|nr:ATP-binding protein [Acidimicrobiia bacterium]
MDKTERAEVGGGGQSALGHLSIPWKFVLTVVPFAVIAVLSALVLWNANEGTTNVVVGAVILIAALGSVIAAFAVGRWIAGSIGEVTAATDRIARKDLIDLLTALRSPDTEVSRIGSPDLDTERGDEIGELGRSVKRLHDVLVEVGTRQMETLRGGISNIFVTLARRNSSLVDRQLAVLDELEEREDDSKILRGYYRVDHLATRMRRNAESLLVLAGSEAPRLWAKPTSMSDVVRAAVGEVDEFQRIEIPALEPARLSGAAVSDLSHLIAELLENAIQFSPPSEAVRVTGLFADGGYQLSVSDRGVGMSEARVAELNRILEKPPTLGLSIDPTLGIYVVSKLAHRHGVKVELIRATPGIIARVTVPREHLEVVEKQSARTEYTDTPPESGTPDRVIDLTEVDLTDSVAAGPVPAETPPTETLPRRNPGQSLGDDGGPAPSIGPGEDANDLKSALSAYDRGRRAAQGSASDTEDEQ